MKEGVIHQRFLAVSLLLIGCVFIISTSGQECSNYRELNSEDRSVSFKVKGSRCDARKHNDFYPGEWHRFVGDAGQMMSEVCVPANRCGTRYPGWLAGPHPSVEDGIVQRKVCFGRPSIHGDCCIMSSRIEVRNCSTFFVYKLSTPPSCPVRYCSIESASDFCTFDNGLCGYMHNQPTTGTEWKLKRKVRKILLKDHTTGKGSFMHASFFWGRGDTIPVGQLISPPMWNIGCLQFYYYRTFNSGGRLDVLIQMNGQKSLVWSVESSDENSWRFASVPITSRSSGPIKVIFQAFLPTDFDYPEISALIDDVKVTSDASSCKLLPSQPEERVFKEVKGSCNFDTSMCGYSSSGYVWRRLGKSTWSRYTQLNHDHTFSTGMYIYAVTSGLRRGGKSQLISPTLKNVQCVTFYYYMHGKHVGELNVYTQAQNTDTRVLRLSGNYGSQWQKAVVYLDKLAADTSFRLIFEVVKGNGGKETIAIDDISTSSCPRPTTTPEPADDNVMVRLAGGDDYSINKGRIEVLYNGKWGTICDDSWTIEDATVVCKMLGFSGAEKAVKNSGFGSGSGDIWLNNVQCTGDENAIQECIHAGWGAMDKCTHSQDAGVICQQDQADWNSIPQQGSCDFGSDSCGYTMDDNSQNDLIWKRESVPSWGKSHGIMKIVTKPSVKAGTLTKLTSPILSPSTKCLRISYLMCPSDYHNRKLFDSDIGTLNIYTKILGSATLQKVWTLSGPQYLEGKYGFVPLNSNGQFQVVFEYISGEIPQMSITIDSIKMFNSSCEIVPFKATPNIDDVKLRLKGGKSNMEGRVEVYAYGVWGRLNQLQRNLRVAGVVCRQLMFAGAVRVCPGSRFGKSMVNGQVWSTWSHIYPMCRSSDTNIGRCLGRRSVPSIVQDGGVECFDARLVGGNSPNEGRVEINYKGKWGTVCNKGWNIKAAHVICRDLGYRRAKRLSSFGQGKGEIRLSDVKCKGNEESISLCSYRGWVVKHCNHSQDVGVVCAD